MIQLVKWNSKDYWVGINLRNELLKKSAGENKITTLPLEERQDIHLVARIGEQVVGTLILSKRSKQVLQVKQVAIDQTSQGAGIGRKLLLFAEKIAELLKFETIYLTGRKQAWGFYKKMGYHSYGVSYQKKQLELKQFKKELIRNDCLMNMVLTRQITLKELETNG